MKCSIKLPKRTSDRKYILFCDEHWYETTTNDAKIFTEEEAYAIIEQMKKHYQNRFVLVFEDGSEVYVPEIINQQVPSTDIMDDNIFA